MRGSRSSGTVASPYRVIATTASLILRPETHHGLIPLLIEAGVDIIKLIDQDQMTEEEVRAQLLEGLHELYPETREARIILDDQLGHDRAGPGAVPDGGLQRPFQIVFLNHDVGQVELGSGGGGVVGIGREELLERHLRRRVRFR